MSEQAVEPQVETDSEPEAFDLERAQAKIRKANDEAKSLRARLKELEPLAQEAERQREASKTETQRLTEERDALRAERDSVRSEAMRSRVALTKGLPGDLADRLRGDTEDALAEDADRLLELLKPSGRAPLSGLRQGVSTPPSADSGERDLARSLFGPSH